MIVYYVAVEPGCGCYTAVAMYDIDKPEEAINMANDFREWRKSGREVKRVETRDDALANFKKCTHKVEVK